MAALALSAGPAYADTGSPTRARALIDVDGPALKRLVRSRKAKLTIVNVWATWCAPCIAEFPDLLATGRKYAPKGVRLLFVTTDFGEARAAAVEFLKQQRAPLPSYIKAGKDEPFIEALSPEWVGTLPATFIFDRTGRRLRFFQGKIERWELERTLDTLLAKKQDK